VELCQQLHEVTPGVPVILYSGDVYQVMGNNALEAGATAYVTKPDIEELIETVSRLLKARTSAVA